MRPIGPGDAAFVEEAIVRAFGSPVVVSADGTRDAREFPGFVAVQDGERVGVVIHRLADEECEVVAIAGFGVGAALLAAVVDEARRAGCQRVWLVTTNDNTRALRSYQRNGFDLVALRRFAVDEARRVKPEIPALGNDGIPIRHELVLELRL